MISVEIFALFVLVLSEGVIGTTIPMETTVNASSVTTFEDYNTTSVMVTLNGTTMSNTERTTGYASTSWNPHSTEGIVIDASGCIITLRNETEEGCFLSLESNVESTFDIFDETEKEEVICCAVEEYEKCCIEGFKAANCETDQKAIRNTVKATSVFMAALNSVICAGYRGKCSFSSFTPSTVPSYYLVASGLLATVILV
ncbi:uncharacterized protein NPIL_226241 [Nephila pilipes]|uniref:Uncharacterized protein n=1 Tax=Nephila pilipes TaxID=299642 RepID=A0A8X6UP42_NEPPI|nr:uncharacterized protein NPIL_226241 [Nephila pilipes]